MVQKSSMPRRHNPFCSIAPVGTVLLWSVLCLLQPATARASGSVAGQPDHYMLFWALICAGLLIVLIGTAAVALLVFNRRLQNEISERVAIETSLRDREAFLTTIFKAAPIGIGLVRQRRIIWISSGFTDMFGYVEGELVGQNTKMIYPLAAEFERVGMLLYDQIDAKGVGEVEGVMKAKDGQPVNVLLRAAPLEPGSAAEGVLFTILDITARKKAEEAVSESEARFRALVRQAAEAIFIFDVTGRFRDVNDMACKTLGYAREELLTMKIQDVDPAAIQFDEGALWKNLNGRTPPIFESWYHRKSGDEFPVEVSLSQIQYRGEQLILALARDISERKKAEADRRRFESQLQQIQKMEALGTLAGGIAHDFNNILGIILGNTELVEKAFSDSEDIGQNLEEIRAAALRAKGIVRQVLAFAQKADEQKKPVKVAEVVEETINLLRATIPATVKIKYQIELTNEVIMANPVQLRQIVMNLCSNAAQAMFEDGGVIEIHLSRVMLDDSRMAADHDLEPGRYLKLTVADTGHGIEPELIDRIFDPYFTTQKTGDGGTGMGLSVVKGIVGSLSGDITVASAPGAGTTFEILLPITGIAEGDVPVRPMPETVTGQESILVVDDERALLRMAQHMLASLGYKVRCLENPVAALTEFRENPDAFDLIVADMTMPEMTGLRLAKEVMRIRPDCPVIICTGHSDLVNEESAMSQGIRAMMMKPFTGKELAWNIRKAIDGEAAA